MTEGKGRKKGTMLATDRPSAYFYFEVNTDLSFQRYLQQSNNMRVMR
jgi:hypothetical protein